MGLIKSAWEIALEKTKEIQVDPLKIAHDEQVQAGRKVAAAFLSDTEKDSRMVKEEMEKVPEGDKMAFSEGILAVILDNLTLPQSKDFHASLHRLEELALVLENTALTQGLAQIGQLFDQYISQKDAVVEQAKAQYAPLLEQKIAKLRQQYGQEINLQPEQDADFLKMLDGTLKQMDAQYNTAITRFKQQVKALFQF